MGSATPCANSWFAPCCICPDVSKAADALLILITGERNGYGRPSTSLHGNPG